MPVSDVEVVSPDVFENFLVRHLLRNLSPTSRCSSLISISLCHLVRQPARTPSTLPGGGRFLDLCEALAGLGQLPVEVLFERRVAAANPCDDALSPG